MPGKPEPVQVSFRRAIVLLVVVSLVVSGIALLNSFGGTRDRSTGEAGCTTSGNPPQISYDYFNVDTGSVLSAISSGTPVSVPFHGGAHTLQLAAYNLGVPGAKIIIDDTTQIDPPFSTAIGYQTGDTSSLALVTVYQNYFDAMLYLPSSGGWFFDSNIPGSAINGSIHRGWNMTSNPLPTGPYINDMPPSCEGGGGGSGPSTRGSAGPQPLHNLVQQNLLATADMDYVGLFWWCPFFFGIADTTCAASAMATEVARLNNVFNGLQSRGVNTPMVNFNVAAYDVHTRNANGGMTSFDGFELIGQFRTHDVNVHDANLNYHASHLFTGKELNGNVIGLGGWGGQGPDFQAHWSMTQQVSAGLSTYQATDWGRMIANSQEIGHTYNAHHEFAVHIRLCILFLCFDFFTIMWPAYMGDASQLSRFSDDVTDNLPPASANSDRVHAEAHVKVQR